MLDGLQLVGVSPWLLPVFVDRLSGWEGDPVPAGLIKMSLKTSEAAGTGSPSLPDNLFRSN